jgi:hypothetical protein
MDCVHNTQCRDSADTGSPLVLQGLPTAQQLAAQLPAAMRHVRQGSYLPAQGAGLASIGVAKLASLLKVLLLPHPAPVPVSKHSTFNCVHGHTCIVALQDASVNSNSTEIR